MFQVGCPMRCTFCATGKGGFARNLMAHEIVDQVMTVQETFGQRVSNVGESYAPVCVAAACLPVQLASVHVCCGGTSVLDDAVVSCLLAICFMVLFRFVTG